MHPQKKFHMALSALMGAMMISIMTMVITAVNVGLRDGLHKYELNAAVGGS